MTAPPSSRTLTLIAVVILLGVMEALMLFSVRQESQTSDEAYNLLAGYLHLTASDFSICPAYPPLTHDVAALPLLALRPRMPPMTPEEASEFQGGRIFLYANRADELLFAARAAMTVFPLLLALLVFLAAREMFDTGPAFLALGLVVFEPNILAHGPLATNDVALAFCLFAGVYAFWRYVTRPSIKRLVVCGLAGGFTLAAKHSGLILFPILFLLCLLEALISFRGGEESSVPAEHQESSPNRRVDTPGQDARPAAIRLALRLLMALSVITVISVAVLWGFYLFRYNARSGIEVPWSAWASLLGGIKSHATVTAISLAAHLHLLPEAYLHGLAFFFASDTRPTYLLGTRFVHGVWFYFPTVFVIKSTLGFLLLLALAAWARLLSTQEGRRKILWMLIPATFYLGASMTSNLNIGVRHILPIYPFLAVWVGAGAWKLARSHRAWGLAVGSLLLIHAASSLWAFPNFLPYSNELWGGPNKTYRALTDSNVDWGQGLLAMQRYLKTHAATPCWFAYFGTVDPAYYHLPCTLLESHTAVVWGRPLSPTPPVIEGTVFVSATEMSGQMWGPGTLNPYEQFRTGRPVGSVGGSILVYKGRFDVPLASALSKLWEVVALAGHGEYDAALAEARQAEALAPQSVDVQFVLGRVLRAAGRHDEARQAFRNAFNLALTIHPEAQTDWIPIIAAEMRKP